MYRNVLAAVNKHLNSEVAARYALRFAATVGARFFLAFIAERGLSRNEFERAEEALKRLFLEAERQGVPVEKITGSGDPVAEIGRIVRKERVGLTFAATRREDVEKRFFAGTTARRLVLRLPCSVSLVRVVHLGRIHPGKILVPLKSRVDHLRERAYFAAKMAACCASQVILFHAPKPITRFFHGEVLLTPLEWQERLPGDIGSFMDHLGRLGVKHEGILSPGRTAHAITVEAAARRHDLIIMGASERNLLTSILRGNPVEEVLRETPCDLIIFKPRHEG